MQSPLRNVRKAHGFTLQHVAAGVQVNPATLSRIDPYFRYGNQHTGKIIRAGC